LAGVIQRAIEHTRVVWCANGAADGKDGQRGTPGLVKIPLLLVYERSAIARRPCHSDSARALVTVR